MIAADGLNNAELRAINAGLRCRDHAFRRNLVMRAVRDTMVLAPPLVISRAQIDELVALAKAAIDATARDFGRL